MRESILLDTYGKKVQREGSESRDSDCLKHFKRHGFDDMKACNYISIYKVRAIDRVNIKLQYSEFTYTEIRKTTTCTPKYWIWLKVDKEDPREPYDKNSCPGPFTTNWEHCVNHNLKNLTELSNHLEHVSKLEEDEVVDDPAPKERPVKTRKRKKRQHAKSSTQSSCQDSGPTSSQPSAQDVQQ